MKKRIILVSAALVLVLCSAAALAVNNGSGESLVSLSYLTNTFLPGLMQQAENKLEPLEQVYDQVSIQLDQKAASYLAQASGTEGSAVLYSACFADTPLHRGDTLALSTGAGFLLREGSAKVTHNGTVVDITTGSTIPSGGKLNINHRYLVGEETSASFYISSEAATAAVEGFYTSASGGLSTMPFVDVSEDDWFHTAVTYAYGRGLFSGTSANTFSPNMDITRAMVVTVLYQLTDRPAAEGHTIFTDVSADAYYAAPVSWATSQGITAGMGDNQFSPNRNITREQLACMLYRYACNVSGLDVSVQGDLSRFTDQGQISSYAVDALSWAVGAGIITGMDSSTLAPQGTATRAQMAAMLNAFQTLF